MVATLHVGSASTRRTFVTFGQEESGGLTLSEALAAGRPFISTGAVPGQETLNESWAVRNGAAVAAAPGHVGRVVFELSSRGLLETMGKRALLR